MRHLSALFLAAILLAACSNNHTASLDNGIVRLEFNLKSGTFDAYNNLTGEKCVEKATAGVDGMQSTSADRITAIADSVSDSIGTGSRLTITAKKRGKGSAIFSYTLYKGKPFVVMECGVDNATTHPVTINRMSPLEGARLFRASDLSRDLCVVDGEGGGNPTFIRHEPSLHSSNNMILHFGNDSNYKSLVCGGISYDEFAKYVTLTDGQDRLTDFCDNEFNLKLLDYLDVGDDPLPLDSVGERVTLSRTSDFIFEGNQACRQVRSVAWADSAITISLEALKQGKPYTVALSWCDDSHERTQTVSLKDDDGTRRLIDAARLPSLLDGSGGEMVYIDIPIPANGKHPKLVLTRNSGANALVSEVALLQGHTGRGVLRLPVNPRKSYDYDKVRLTMEAKDVVGKRIEPKSAYTFSNDRFYIDFVTRNPIYSAEQYASTLRVMQNVRLNYYYFPTICLWYAMMPRYGGDVVMGTNDTRGAVDEMERVKASGFLRYTTMGIRLVPDCYGENNENGWWDDLHWQLHGSGNQEAGMKLKGAHYCKPYETSRKWAEKILSLGGLPFTYFQTAVRSRDYAEAHPSHMLFNEPFHKVNTYDWLNYDYASYDFTDKGFLSHMRDVYSNLHQAGIRGMMFDYPYTGWPIWGGMDDPHTTAAKAYRTIFQLAHDGLGPSAYIHERNLKYGSDIALGYVASQRTWSDNDVITPEMIMRSGLRWYKDRVVVNYDMDAKNLRKADQDNPRDGLNKLLTMSLATASRLLLANSFGSLDSTQIHRLSRVFPYHQLPRSPRPLDAFTTDYPRVYGMSVSDGWTALTFYNDDDSLPKRISIQLAGIPGRGGIGLNPEDKFYVYDFWNDSFLGEYHGTDILAQTLRRGEARQMAVRRVESHPQVLSTDRHILQGALELEAVEWNESESQLSGKAKLIGGEPMTIVIACNGKAPASCGATGTTACGMVFHDGLVKLTLCSEDTKTVKFNIDFK